MSEPTVQTMEERFPHVTQEYLEEIARMGEVIYEKLKPKLEPVYNNHFITIHVDNEDYAIGKNSSMATRAIRQRQPLDGRLYCRKIGDEPDYGLAVGYMLSDKRKARQK